LTRFAGGTAFDFDFSARAVTTMASTKQTVAAFISTNFVALSILQSSFILTKLTQKLPKQLPDSQKTISMSCNCTSKWTCLMSSKRESFHKQTNDLHKVFLNAKLLGCLDSDIEQHSSFRPQNPSTMKQMAEDLIDSYLHKHNPFFLMIHLE